MLQITCSIQDCDKLAERKFLATKNAVIENVPHLLVSDVRPDFYF